jgi:hypothetical protein
MNSSFIIDSKQEDLKGALLYKLRRKYTRTYKRPKSSSIFEDTEASTHLLVVWNVGTYDYIFFVYLIECTDDSTWDEDKLWTLCKEYDYKFREGYKSSVITWLVHDRAAMKMRFDTTYGSDYKLNIVISEGTSKYNMKRPMQIDLKRLVLSLSMLIVLIHAVSLPIQPSIKLSIHNQCLNVDLVSPIYTTYGRLECHRAPNHNAYVGDVMRCDFIVCDSGNESCGILICELQRKQLHESTEICKDTSNAAYLLVVWGISKSNRLYADVLLIEHDKIFIWSIDKLRELYRKNVNQFRLHPVPVTETWLLDDNTALTTTSKIVDRDLTLNIIIFETERDNSTRIPAHIDLKR